MGSSIMLKIQQQFHSRSFHWITSSTNSYCTKVIDSNSHLQGQKYVISSNIVQQQWQLLQLRKRYSPYFIEIYDIINKDTHQMCTKQHQLHIIIEQIQYRFSDLVLISFEEAIYILKTVLEGYKMLVHKQIPFYLLDQSNICFNKKGMCKFWINQNIYLAKPNNNRIIAQQHFIQVLLEIVELKIDEINQTYLEIRQANNYFSLDQILKIIYKFQNRDLFCIERLASDKYRKSLHKLMIYNDHSVEKKKMPQKVSIKKCMYNTSKKFKQASSKNVHQSHRIGLQSDIRSYNYASVNHETQTAYKLSLSSKLRPTNKQTNVLMTLQSYNFSTPRAPILWKQSQQDESQNPQFLKIPKRSSSNHLQSKKTLRMKQYLDSIQY